MNADPRMPHFRFFPTAYEHENVFVRSDKTCPVCGEPFRWQYVSTIYTTHDIDTCCAACISTGRLGEYIGDCEFALHDCELSGVGRAIANEVLQRTPGFPTYNAFDWPVAWRTPLAFVGHGDDEIFVTDITAHQAIADVGRSLGDETWTYPAPYTLLFKHLKHQKYHAIPDFD